LQVSVSLALPVVCDVWQVAGVVTFHSHSAQAMSPLELPPSDEDKPPEDEEPPLLLLPPPPDEDEPPLSLDASIIAGAGKSECHSKRKAYRECCFCE